MIIKEIKELYNIARKYKGKILNEDYEKLLDLVYGEVVVSPSVPPFENCFYEKGYGRIVVDTEEEKIVVLKIIEDLDEYEFENYYPDDLVVVGDGDLIYVGKFFLNLEVFLKKCREHEILSIIKSQTYEEYFN